MRHLPIFLSLASRRALVVGGGAVAAARVRHLLAAGAAVTVIAPGDGPGDRPGDRQVTSEIAGLAARGEIALARRGFRRSDVDGSAVVFAAACDDGVESEVSRTARDAGVPVNVADRADLSSFIMPAIVDRDPVLVAVSTGGAAPVLAREVRARIERILPAELGRLAKFAESFRGAVKATIGGKQARRRFWENFFDSETAGLALRGEVGAAAADMLSLVNRGAREAADGIVHFMVAGSGDADLLTIRAHRLLLRADAVIHDLPVDVIHDRRVDADILNMARREAERVAVAGLDQEEINASLIDRARRGQHVVRLRLGDPMGDPMIFPGADVERAALAAAGVRFDFVPGVASAELPAARAVAS
jgi:uroporphyrin-III C-methyltransferase/precorrin-2 dehydrogenase/sirohydrochlorin ferrochelatase